MPIASTQSSAWAEGRGTSNCTRVMQALPYGFPKIMVSTVASGDTSAFVGIKDITMMFSVSDIMGVNAFTAKILANAAAAAYGMSLCEVELTLPAGGKPLIGMTNLGVLTAGATKAVEYFHEAGYEVVVFHAVGSGGRAMGAADEGRGDRRGVRLRVG